MLKKQNCLLVVLLSGCQLLSPPNVVIPVTDNIETVENISTVPTNDNIEAIESVLTPQEQTNLWRRISMQLSFEVPDNELIDYYRQWYLDNPTHLQVVSERAEPFLYLITTKIESRHLPLELALLPVVESSFDPFAYSSGSAAGLWQIIPVTGKRFGLIQNNWYDGRRDVNAATDAALDYLTLLNKRFNGDWNLTIAAYNSGGGRVASAVTKNKQQGKPTDFFSLELPQETNSYLPKLLALADIIAHSKKYGVTIPPIANQPKLTLVDPKEQLDLTIAASYANISVEELQRYNPAYIKGITAPKGPYKLLIPVEHATAFQQQLKKNRGKGIKLKHHKVQPGDTLSTIAQRYHSTVQHISERNKLTNNKIKVGQSLTIPINTAVTTARHSSNQPSSSSKKSTYVVKNGDTLWSIAKAHQVQAQSIAKWNNISAKSALKVGQKIIIEKTLPTEKKSSTANTPTKKASINSTELSKKAKTTTNVVNYKVRAGDTLGGIAQRFNVSSNDIAKWNKLDKKAYLKLGQNLVLHVTAPN